MEVVQMEKNNSKGRGIGHCDQNVLWSKYTVTTKEELLIKHSG